MREVRDSLPIKPLGFIQPPLNLEHVSEAIPCHRIMGEVLASRELLGVRLDLLTLRARKINELLAAG